MSGRGELNHSQLVRERFGRDAFAIGFSTYSGTVTAARDWGGPAERRRVRPGIAGSYEELFHCLRIPNFWLNLREKTDSTKLLRDERLQRDIGCNLPARNGALESLL
jgi:erythromycin esterase-like protein